MNQAEYEMKKRLGGFQKAVESQAEYIKDVEAQLQTLKFEKTELENRQETAQKKEKALLKENKKLEKLLTMYQKQQQKNGQRKELRSEQMNVRVSKTFLLKLAVAVQKMNEKYPESKFFRADILEDGLILFMKKNRIRFP